MKKYSLLFVALIMVGGPSFAKKYRLPYHRSGCGFGSILIPNNDGTGAQIGSSLLNGIWSNRYFAISSGTSNCTDDPSHSHAYMEQEVFVTANMAHLSKEAAQGSGEHLAAFAEVLGCTEQLETFSQVSQANHSEIFNSSNPKEVLDSYSRHLKANSVLASSCSRIS